MPEVVEMRFTIPPELGPEAELLAELRDRVREVEVEVEVERSRTGRRRSTRCQSYALRVGDTAEVGAFGELDSRWGV